MASIESLPPSVGNNPNSKRRRFQAPITSFFAASNGTETTSCASPSSNNNKNYESPTSSLHPVLPNKIQSSLLTVGMRIRKSVPEGYKTSSMMKPSPESFQPGKYQATEEGTYAELTPYCGIMKTGNLSVQTFPRTNASIPLKKQQLFDQEGSVFSTGLEEVAEEVLPASTKKRGFELDEDGHQEMDVPPSASQSSLPSLTPSSSQSSTASTFTLPFTTRHILQPRVAGEKKVRFANPKFTSADGQENIMHPIVIDDGDFGEASFLQRKEDLEMDLEVG